MPGLFKSEIKIGTKKVVIYHNLPEKALETAVDMWMKDEEVIFKNEKSLAKWLLERKFIAFTAKQYKAYGKKYLQVMTPIKQIDGKSQ